MSLDPGLNLTGAIGAVLKLQQVADQWRERADGSPLRGELAVILTVNDLRNIVDVLEYLVHATAPAIMGQIAASAYQKADEIIASDGQRFRKAGSPSAPRQIRRSRLDSL